MKLKEIQELIRYVSKSGVCEVELETKDIKLIIKATGKKRKGTEEPTTIVQQVPMGAAGMPMQQVSTVPTQQAAAMAAPNQPAQETNKDSVEDKYEVIKSPMIGTFYRRPSPDKDTFVEVGQSIKKGDVVCVIEAMKLFNEIEAEISGKIVKFLVDDNSPVEYDQPLFLVDPS